MRQTPETQIAACIEQMDACEASFVEWAIKAGDILNDQKAKLDHGDWSDWLSEYWPKGYRTATRYITIATSEVDRKTLIESGSIRKAVNLAEELNSKVTRASDLPKLDVAESEFPPAEPSESNPQRASDLEPTPEVYEDVEDDEPTVKDSLTVEPTTVDVKPNQIIEEPEDTVQSFACWVKETKRLLPLLDAAELELAKSVIDSLISEESTVVANKSEVGQVFEHYQTYHPTAKLSDKQKKLIKDRLKDGYSVPDIQTAIDGHHRSPHHLGENDRGTKYLRIGLCLDPDKIAGFIEMADADLTVMTEETRRGIRATSDTDISQFLIGNKG